LINFAAASSQAKAHQEEVAEAKSQDVEQELKEMVGQLKWKLLIGRAFSRAERQKTLGKCSRSGNIFQS